NSAHTKKTEDAVTLVWRFLLPRSAAYPRHAHARQTLAEKPVTSGERCGRFPIRSNKTSQAALQLHATKIDTPNSGRRRPAHSNATTPKASASSASQSCRPN